jgi:hypothetical protein
MNVIREEAKGKQIKRLGSLDLHDCVMEPVKFVGSVKVFSSLKCDQCKEVSPTGDIITSIVRHGEILPN